MHTKLWLAAAIAWVALGWGPGAAHLFALSNKMALGAEEYLAAQQAYRGWALFGVVVLGELVTTGGFAWISRRTRWKRLAAAAFLCVVAGQVVFWVFTFPANWATESWTSLPQGWEELRRQWEYSHAAGAMLTFAALLCLLGALLRLDGGPGKANRQLGAHERARAATGGRPRAP